MQSVQIVTFVLKKLDHQVRKYSRLHRAVLEKLRATQLVKKFPAFRGTQRFFKTLTRPYHWTISWTI